MATIKAPKKLIEVALPLDAINAASAREKSIRHGHPSTLHLWWARRPLAAARAVIFAQMVNDPGYERHLGRGVNKQKAAAERERLFKLIEELVHWENTNNEDVLARARAEIIRSWRETCELNKHHPQAAELFNPDKLPAFHDPFAGGGALPLEAQRLGLESYASDLNPVAVLINKAMIEIPPRFAGKPPVHPPEETLSPRGRGQGEGTLFAREWKGAQGLAADVRYYGQWMRDEAERRIGHLYPKVEVSAEMAKERPDLKPYVGQKLTVIAWLWVRTVKSPNPAYSHVDVPLASTFMLSTKPGKEAYVEPVIEPGSAGVPPAYRFEVRTGKPKDAEGAKNGTKSGGSHSAFLCLMSGTPMPFEYLREEARAKRMGARLMAIVAEGDRGRVYLTPTAEMEAVALKAKPEWKPEVEICHWPGRTNVVEYGLTTYGDLFTPRQLVALTTFSDLVGEAIEKVKADYLGARARRPRSIWYRTRLPHFEAGEVAQHITFRLADSLPAEVLRRWAEELERQPPGGEGVWGEGVSPSLHIERCKRIEAYLDQGHGACHLRDPRIAGIVADALRYFDGTRYTLHEWVVMPNHVHVIITPLHGNSLSSIVHSWKSYTAKEANKLLGSAGSFWQEDYFDRAIRDEKHWEAVVAYVRDNPVKAGLCTTPEAWRFGSAWAGDEDGEGDSRARRPRSQGHPRSQDEVPLRNGGTGAQAYAEAVGVYLAFAVDKCADYWSGICSWHSSGEKMRNTFGRQAIPMVWDYAEANPMCDSSGNWMAMVDWTWKALETVPARAGGAAGQADAQTQSVSAHKLVSTDPPYYDNIGYADLSDFFYVWLRRSLRPIFPDLFATLAVPKAEELVATPYRHGSKQKAEAFFLDGMTRAMHRLAEQAHPAFPVTIYYAFKQSESDSANGTASTGWETFLEAVIRAGFAISGTWPMRTELGNRMVGMDTNALASSIVLVCRPRPANAPAATRREFLRELDAALPDALDEMTRGGVNSPVAPVDLSQAIIGPGMAIFSQYAAVLEANGTPMSVRTALQLINRFLAEDDFDHDTQFCLHWFEQEGWATGIFGKADVLARAKGTAVDALVVSGVVQASKGSVRLLKWPEYPADWSPESDTRTPIWEALHQLIRALNQGGESAAGALLARMPSRAEPIRALAYRLYTLCERKGWADDARAYNELVTAWSGIEQAAGEAGWIGSQAQLDF